MPKAKLTDEEKAANKAARAAKRNTEKNLDEKKRELAEKLKDMEGKVKIERKEVKELKSEVKEDKKEDKAETVSKESKLESKDTLVPLEMYIKAGSYIGTKVITPDMRKYVYRRRNDGIAIINTNLIDEKLKEAIRFLNTYAPKDWVLVCKREAGWRAVKLFSELTGVRVFTKKYPAGIITNISLPTFFETEMIFICDPWLDKNALNDALNVRRKVMGVCDTNNLTKGVNVVVPANNKGNKSLGLILWIIAREYMHARSIEKELPNLEEFIGEKLEELPMKEKKKEKAKEEEKKKDEAKIEALMKEEKKEE
jgi:small subunit ribosomal protein S2